MENASVDIAAAGNTRPSTHTSYAGASVAVALTNYPGRALCGETVNRIDGRSLLSIDIPNRNVEFTSEPRESHYGCLRVGSIDTFCLQVIRHRLTSPRNNLVYR